MSSEQILMSAPQWVYIPPAEDKTATDQTVLKQADRFSCYDPADKFISKKSTSAVLAGQFNQIKSKNPIFSRS